MMRFPEWSLCAGERLGYFLNLLFQRGLEFALAMVTIINGRAALSSDLGARPLAPFLHSALSQLSHEPYVWSLFLISIGTVHLLVLLGTLFGKRTAKRAIMAFIQTAVYVAITTAILTSDEPIQSAERYAMSAAMAFLCFVVLTARTISEMAKQGGSLNG